MASDQSMGTSVDTRPRIHLEGVAKSFNGRTVVDVEQLTLGDHPIEGLIGPNGAGKTTLMRLIMHSASLDRGTVTFYPNGPDSEPVTLSETPPHRMAHLGVVKSNQVIMDFDKLTVLDSLLLAAASTDHERGYRLFNEDEVYGDARSEIDWYLDRFDFQDPLGHARSAGEKKLLDIIRCLLLRPRLLLLDEPTAGLPDEIRDRLTEVLKEKCEQTGMSVIVVEHDLSVIWTLSHYVHFMAEGSVILQGDPEWIRQHDTVIEKYLGSEHVGD